MQLKDKEYHPPKKRVLLINGPKSSGKDFGSDFLYTILSKSTQLKFAKPLYDGLQGMFGLDPDHWAYIYNNHKETPCDELFGLSPREAMIWLSEDVLKPKFGKNVMGIIARNVTKFQLTAMGHNLVIFSDSGFAEEAIEVVAEVGAENVYLLQIHADGCNYDGDSRDYVNPKDIGISDKNFAVVVNTKNDAYKDRLLEAIEKFD